MSNDVLFAFSIFQLIFLLLDILILTKTDRNIARKDEYTWFCVLIITHIVYLVVNTVWTLIEYNVFSLPAAIMPVLYIVSLWSVTNCSFSFFLFVVERLELKKFQVGIGVWLKQIPIILTTILIITSPWSGFVFSLADGKYFTKGVLYLPMLLLASVYLLIVLVVSILNIIREKTKSARKANGVLLASVLIIIVFVILDGLLGKASILPAAIFSVIVGIFITMQESNINSDALTGMNNRRKAEDYLTNALKDVSDKKPLILYMGDLNNFKKINDTFGHTIGDEALILCSKAITQTISKYNGFAARYGGDEFILSYHLDKNSSANPDRMIDEINEILKDESKDKEYDLVMTIGYTYCVDQKEQLLVYIKEADNMLYQRKKDAGVGR